MGLDVVQDDEYDDVHFSTMPFDDDDDCRCLMSKRDFGVAKRTENWRWLLHWHKYQTNTTVQI